MGSAASNRRSSFVHVGVMQKEMQKAVSTIKKTKIYKRYQTQQLFEEFVRGMAWMESIEKNNTLFIEHCDKRSILSKDECAGMTMEHKVTEDHVLESLLTSMLKVVLCRLFKETPVCSLMSDIQFFRCDETVQSHPLFVFPDLQDSEVEPFVVPPSAVDFSALEMAVKKLTELCVSPIVARFSVCEHTTPPTVVNSRRVSFSGKLPLNVTGMLMTQSNYVSDRLIDPMFTDPLLQTDWMCGLVEAVDHISVCVSVAYARPEHKGFPLLYVNKAFEQMSGHTCSSLVGRSCRFMQCEETGTWQRSLLTTGLKNATEVRVALTNVRNNGQKFTNLLALKPIFDKNGEYTFVVVVQVDMSAAQQYSEVDHLRRVEAVLALMPALLAV